MWEIFHRGYENVTWKNMLPGVRKRYVTKYDGGSKPLRGKYFTGGTETLR